MSSINIRKPEFRLLLGYPDVVLTRDGSAEPVGTAAPGSDRFGADLKRLAAEVLRCSGRLTVVLPASEVWRGQIPPGGRTPGAGWRSARARAAASLGVAPESLRAIVGPRSTGGHMPAAAVRRSTLTDVRALLASVGLKPAAIVGAGAFEGFDAPPRLGGRWAPPPAGQRRALVGAGGLAVAAIALMMMALRPDSATVAPIAVTPPPAIVAVVTPPATVPAATVVAAVKPIEPVRIARADPPPRRPAEPLVPKGSAAQPIATLGTRNVPMVFVEDKGKPVAELRLAELTDPRGPLTDVAVPLHRPLAKPAPLSAGALGPVPTLRPEPRPGKVAAKAPAPEAKTAALAGPALAGDRPLPRPEAKGAVKAEAKPVRVASLGDQVSDAVIAAKVMTPLARPEESHAVALQPAAVAVVPKPVAPKPVAPKPVAAKPVAPRPVASAALVAPPRVVAPAPKLVAAPAPKPVAQAAPRTVPTPAPKVQRVVRVEQTRPTPTPQPVRVATVSTQKVRYAVTPTTVVASAPAPTVRRQTSATAAGFSNRVARNDVALIGIFGGSDGRKALVRMPNGKIRKVQAGDSIQGVRIASIGSDSVRVTDGRRESVIEMPD